MDAYSSKREVEKPKTKKAQRQELEASALRLADGMLEHARCMRVGFGESRVTQALEKGAEMIRALVH